MENVFKFRDDLVKEYSSFSRSFVSISADDIKSAVENEYSASRYWPEPLIQINPNYQRKGTVQELAAQGVLHPKCAEIFKTGKTEGRSDPLYLYKHQIEALAKGQGKQSYVVTTGTGSGKSLSFFIPVIDSVLKGKESDPTPRTRAIVIYPMNALANSQLEELGKFLEGFPTQAPPFTVARYTGQESKAERKEIANNPPDILLTNFMMLELILTRYEGVDKQVVNNCMGLEFIILDELHTYRGRQGADVAILVRRLRERLSANDMTCIGTSATMSSTGKQVDRNRVVASVASKLFGAEITEHDVIGETLERVTNQSKDVAAVKGLLKTEIESRKFNWVDFETFKDSAMAIWVELNLGIEIPSDEPPKRAKPKTLGEASRLLAKDASVSDTEASLALQEFLVAAHEVRTPQGRAPFAFKLHQFISGPGKVLTTLEPENVRTITLDAQRFAPGKQDQEIQLYPTHFCRDCGQEFHPVWKTEYGQIRFDPREIGEITVADNDELSFGFLCLISNKISYSGALEDLPETWIDFSKAQPKVKSTYKKSVPIPFTIDAQGIEGRGGNYWYIPGKFRFCLCCNQLHEAHGKDINRLASLSGEGRSSATTVLTLSALRQLFQVEELPAGIPDPRKLLGFTDNRQDAALQAGHFNDFIFLLTLRAGLIGALQNNNNALDEERLSEEVFKSLGFSQLDEETLSEYLRTPKLMGLARQEAQRTLRYIIGYRLIRDLRRGWRFNNPNLDQLGLLDIKYRGLEEFCAEDSLYASSKNSVLIKLSSHNRENLCRTLFDEMRRALCLETRYLDTVEQDKARNSAFTYLNERWAFAPDEKLEVSKHLILKKRPEYKGKPRNDLISGGERSRVLKQIKTAKFWKNTAFADQVSSWKDPEWVDIISALLEISVLYGYIQKHSVEKGLAGFRLNASALEWNLVPAIKNSKPENSYFKELYLNLAALLQKPNHPLFHFEAQEHTAQVDAGRRQLLEQRFRYTEKDQKDWIAEPGHEAPLERLPIMFCSPTMELGVDISALNTVYLRNVPPTPANYAQRSGRAGRSGQQALVITYCASLSPHDQWFFHNANEMVHGVVKAPTLDLGNRELVESHLHAVWLACAEVELDSSISPLVNLDDPAKPLQSALIKKLSDPKVIEKARCAAAGVIKQLENELNTSHWFTSDYIDTVINQAPQSFSQAIDRWRALFDATRKQMDMAESVAKSHTASDIERANAKRRWGDAANQYGVLLKAGNNQNSDFYTYRYLASQGFLPGYNFPRLPLMAWIPARGGQTSAKNDEGSMVSRPRFLALSEFGPRSLIYHQGRMYRVTRAKLNVGNSDHISGNSTLATITSRVCSQCGYGHLGQPGGEEPLFERCENCDALLTEDDWVKELYRIETVETQPVERISINDEDRQRQGFELQTTYRFLPGPDGKIQKQKAIVESDGDNLAELNYAPAARIWRINRGWRRRKDKNQLGFYINPITGTWSKQDDPSADEDTAKDEGAMEKVANQRIVPFVEDHRNLLIMSPIQPLSIESMATVQAALKRGIEMTFQIEESELVAEPLPKLDDRKSLLFYEAAEGGAGILTRLATEPESLALVASKALEIMHYTSPEGSWEFGQLAALEKKNQLNNSLCEAGCYQCLLSYFNQPDHENINRRDADALRLLVALANANVNPVDDANENIMATTPMLESIGQQWLEALNKNSLKQPDAKFVAIAGGAATATAQYKAARTLIFTESVSAEITQQLHDKGWQCIDASNQQEWDEIFSRYATVFGITEDQS